MNGKNNTSKELVVRREKILQALLWLTGKNGQGEPNNFLYSEITLDMEKLERLPENGFVTLPELNEKKNDSESLEEGEKNESDEESEDVSESEELPDLGPINDDIDERVFNENTEMRSYLPSKLKKAKEADLTKSEILNTKTEIDIGSSPLSEFNTPYLASLAFPTLFPDTKGDPTNPAIIREIAKSETEGFAEKLKHLIKFAEIDDKGKWFYRFSSHPRFSFWGFNMLYRKRLINQGNFFIKQNPGEANLSVEELCDLVRDNDHYVVMKKLQRYSKNVTGTNAYWCDVKEKLKATITQMGTPTIFWTLSMADFHWPDIHDLFLSNESENTDFRQNIIDNPHIVDWLFTERVKNFVKHWLYESLNAEWHWYRFEFAVMRGSIHCHGLAKLKSDPGICELTEKALQGFLAKETLSNQTEIDLENNTLLHVAIMEGNSAERQICDYVDSLMTAINPIDGPANEWEKPSVHPCKIRLEDIPEEDLEQDYIDLANSVQRHTKCSSAYCLRTKNDKQECRFKFPFESCEKTHLIFEKLKLKGGKEKYVPNIVLKRNDPRMNRHQQLQLQSWRANCDIQIILDHNACLNYIVKYASKAEKISDVAKEAFTSVIENLSGEETSGNIFRKLIIKSVGERDFSAQEVMHQIMSLKLHCSSFEVISCSLEGSRQIKIANGELETKTSFLDDYASRYMHEDDEIRQSNLIDFISKWKLNAKDKKIQKRNKSVVVRTFPNYSPNPKNGSYPLFCKFQLIKYKPWKDTTDTLWEGLQATNETFCQKWKEFLNSPLGKELVPDWKRHYINANNSEHQVENEESDENDEQNENSFLREDWMEIADVNSVPSNISENREYWTDSFDSYTQEQINSMPFWIEEMKNSFQNKNTTDYNQYQVENLNAEQLQAYNIVHDHASKADEEPLLMIITGIAGSGKSYLINCIKKLLDKKCLLTSYFGIAAFNINGRTLHSTLRLPIRDKLNHELKGNSLGNLQTRLKDVKYIIIDEFSVVGQRLLGWIDSRCRQATGKEETFFGGISIILVGDVAQLPPVMDDVLYNIKAKKGKATEGFLAYCCFRTVVELKSNMRSTGEDVSQKKFRNALRNLRNGNSTIEDWNFFLTRQPEKNFIDYNNCTRLSFANEAVNEHNTKMLDSLQSPIAVIKAKNTPPSASKLSSEEFSLTNKVFLSKGARVMLTRNLWPDVGLCNGSLGIVKDIIFQRNLLPPSLPIAVIVKFDKYTGPSFFNEEDNCVPIVPIVETLSDDNVQKERMQIPLKLAWALTIHKSQGLTLDKVVVDLGKRESMDGLTYVALSRVRKLKDMVIESFPFERINKLSNSKSFKYRIQEEKRLKELAARNKPHQ
ncbi:uncharacterized protein [Clytia hemisphaerica]|uniref:uncharacterized protein n=1 Tax=Clytia hemisphaerica TaxID=252671 RepID=UPI0034D75E64